MTKKQLKQGLIKMINQRLSERPFTMQKTLQESYTQHGFFTSTYVPAVYDIKMAYSMDEVIKLVKNGYGTNEDLGSFLFHAIIYYE